MSRLRGAARDEHKVKYSNMSAGEGHVDPAKPLLVPCAISPAARGGFLRIPGRMRGTRMGRQERTSMDGRGVAEGLTG